MKNSFFITRLAKNRKSLEYIYICACSNIVYTDKSSNYICQKCKNSKFLDVNSLDTEYREFLYEKKVTETNRFYKVKYFFKRPYIDAKTNDIIIKDHNIFAINIDKENNLLTTMIFDEEMLEHRKVYKNDFKKLIDIIQEELLPIVIQKYYIPLFDKHKINYHIPKDCSLELKKLLVDYYVTKCKNGDNNENSNINK